MYMYIRTCIYITISSMNYIIVLLCTPSSACQLEAFSMKHEFNFPSPVKGTCIHSLNSAN